MGQFACVLYLGLNELYKHMATYVCVCASYVELFNCNRREEHDRRHSAALVEHYNLTQCFVCVSIQFTKSVNF
jgi:hypothetical protein